MAKSFEEIVERLQKARSEDELMRLLAAEEVAISELPPLQERAIADVVHSLVMSLYPAR